MSDSDYSILKNDFITFAIFELDIEMIESETAYGKQVVAYLTNLISEVSELVYLPVEDQNISIESAINIYQLVNDTLLSQEEIEKVIEDNSTSIK